MKHPAFCLLLSTFGLLTLAACRPATLPIPPVTEARLPTATLPPYSQATSQARQMGSETHPPAATLPPLSARPSSPVPAATPIPEVALTAPTPPPLGLSTPDPNLGVGDVLYEDRFDDTSKGKWLRESDAVLFAVAGGQLNAVMTQGNVGSRFSAWEQLRIGDQQLRVVARTNLCYPRDEYGILFRLVVDALKNYYGYIFKLNCAGLARVELLENVQATPLVDWTPSTAIVPGAPAENVLMVWMAKDQFHFYVNDRYLFSMQDATYAEGFYGFYVRDRTNGGESVSFDDLVVREVKLP